MELTFKTIYKNLNGVAEGAGVDLGPVTKLDPWVVGMLCLLAIERKGGSKKQLLLPTAQETADYLQKTGFTNFLGEISYGEFPKKAMPDYNVKEITHSLFRDDFNARLSTFKSMFHRFGVSDKDDINRAVVLIGELGNNVFDHNEGSWPTDVRGAIILGQNYPQEKRLEMVVADPGIGFRQSLRTVDPNLSDLEAIKLGLEGRTGRVGEKRGNGLILIQDWVINKFNGTVRIHSGSGLVTVDKRGTKSRNVNNILGTLAGFVITYR